MIWEKVWVMVAVLFDRYHQLAEEKELSNSKMNDNEDTKEQ